MTKRFGLMVSKKAFGSVLLFLLSGLLSLSLCLPVNALELDYTVRNLKNSYTQGGGRLPYVRYVGGGTDFPFTQAITHWSNWADDSSRDVTIYMRNSGNGSNDYYSGNIIEYTLITNNLDYRGFRRDDNDFQPLGCVQADEVAPYTAWQCLLRVNITHSYSEGTLISDTGTWAKIADGYTPQMHVVSWYQWEVSPYDYTSQLSDLSSLSSQILVSIQENTNRSVEIRDKLTSLNTTLSAISTKLDNIANNSSTSAVVSQQRETNAKLDAQAQQDAQDRQDYQTAQQNAQNSASDTSQDFSDSSQSLLSAMGTVIGLIRDTPASNCTITVNNIGPGGVLDIGAVELCAVPNEIRQLINHVFGLTMVVATALLALNVFNAGISLLSQAIGYEYNKPDGVS